MGYADWYPYFWDCQWLDVTDLDPKDDYELVNCKAFSTYLVSTSNFERALEQEVEVNPLRKVPEINYDNNIVIFQLQCDVKCRHGVCQFGRLTQAFYPQSLLDLLLFLQEVIVSVSQDGLAKIAIPRLDDFLSLCNFTHCPEHTLRALRNREVALQAVQGSPVEMMDAGISFDVTFWAF